jgi:hypothetical protein
MIIRIDTEKVRVRVSQSDNTRAYTTQKVATFVGKRAFSLKFRDGPESIYVEGEIEHESAAD